MAGRRRHLLFNRPTLGFCGCSAAFGMVPLEVTTGASAAGTVSAVFWFGIELVTAGLANDLARSITGCLAGMDCAGTELAASAVAGALLASVFLGSGDFP